MTRSGWADLEVRDLRRDFGEVRAVDGVSFTVPAGALTGFVGGNGAGKTTTMRMVMGVLSVTAGEVLWGGRPITAADRRAARLHARGARPLSQAAGARPAHLPRPAPRHVDRSGSRLRDEPPRASRPGRPGARPRREALAGQPAAGPDHRGPHGPAPGPRARRAVQRPRPAGRRQHGRPAARAHGAGRAGALLLAPARPRRAAVRAPRRPGQGQGRRHGHARASCARPRWRVTGWSCPATPAGCATSAGVHAVDVDGSSALLEILRPGAERDLLTEALRRGEVREFAPQRPSLAQIYREVTA